MLCRQACSLHSRLCNLMYTVNALLRSLPIYLMKACLPRAHTTQTHFHIEDTILVQLARFHTCTHTTHACDNGIMLKQTTNKTLASTCKQETLVGVMRLPPHKL